MKFSIIIPTFNRCFMTLAVVSNMAHLLKKSNIKHEFVVVNDGSTDETEEVFINLSKNMPNLVLVKTDKVNGTSRNPGFARNSGAKKATGDVLCFCDGDIFHLVDPLKEINDFLKNKDVHNFYFTGLYFRLFGNGTLDGPRGQESDIPHASWLAVSRENFMTIGGYDERFKIYGNEDHDIVQRFRKKGLKHIVLKNNLGMHPFMEGDRDVALESDSMKKLQMEYQRESSIERNQNVSWGAGEITSNSTNSEKSKKPHSSAQSEINTKDLYLKIDSINMAINALVDGQSLDKKTFNMVNNINQNTVSSINNIFTPKPADSKTPKSVFKFITSITELTFSDFPGFPSEVKTLNQNVDLIILGQIHRQRNIGLYLDNAFKHLDTNGELVVICPFYSNCIGSGNTNSLFNAGYLIYNLIMAGFDCKHAKVSTFKNEIQLYVKKTNRAIPQQKSLDSLVDYFPFDVYQHFNGNILEANWK